MSAADSLRPLFSEWTELRVFFGGYSCVVVIVGVWKVGSVETSSDAASVSFWGRPGCAAADGRAGDDKPFSRNRRRFAMTSRLSSIRDFCASCVTLSLS